MCEEERIDELEVDIKNLKNTVGLLTGYLHDTVQILKKDEAMASELASVELGISLLK